MYNSVFCVAVFFCVDGMRYDIDSSGTGSEARLSEPAAFCLRFFLLLDVAQCCPVAPLYPYCVNYYTYIWISLYCCCRGGGCGVGGIGGVGGVGGGVGGGGNVSVAVMVVVL